jgi:hypothetical protein
MYSAGREATMWTRPVGFIPDTIGGYGGIPLESHEACPGVMVRVREGYRKSEFDGMLGTVKRTFGHPDYAAVDVELEDGRLKLFWHHQLDITDNVTIENPSEPSPLREGGG